ncbi:CLUMA_CG010039, isoform A [Clunio marinus]|uniref:CLUMA_CG010039, isoform A n=1 Tax=Clunio marinus TaxID=568069 RepID=A0A1J1IE47_9DIPT|nr:CLUMA_CG010039, isoform A [Clunio marinus]
MMKSLVLLFLLGVARNGGSIYTRDSKSGEKQIDFINNGVVNAFAGLPVTPKSEAKLDNLLEISDANRYITLAFFNVSWTDSDGGKWDMDSEERSKYGMGRVKDVQGRLIHITDANNPQDHSGCNESLRDSFGKHLPTDNSTPWIALIKRGGCDFEKKILNVYREKAVGVIIYNNISGHELNYMKITKKELLEGNITSVFTPLQKGLTLIEKLKAYENVEVIIKAGTRIDKRNSLNHRSSVLFVTISFIIVMVISMLWLVVYYYQRFRYLQTKENEQKMDTNKAKEALKKIPTKTIKTLSKELESDCCAVCIEAYRLNDVLRSLPCKHDFHKNCIDPWLLEHHTCPLCKARVLKQFGYVNTGSQESIIQLDLDDEEDSETSPAGQRRRYSVSPMPQIRSSESQTSGRSSPDSDMPADANAAPPIDSIVIHKTNEAAARCLTCDGKSKSDGFSGSASLPAKFSTKCPECSEPIQDTHLTLDVSKMKRHSKVRPTILSPNCDNIHRDSDLNDTDTKH